MMRSAVVALTLLLVGCTVPTDPPDHPEERQWALQSFEEVAPEECLDCPDSATSSDVVVREVDNGLEIQVETIVASLGGTRLVWIEPASKGSSIHGFVAMPVVETRHVRLSFVADNWSPGDKAAIYVGSETSNGVRRMVDAFILDSEDGSPGADAWVAGIHYDADAPRVPGSYNRDGLFPEKGPVRWVEAYGRPEDGIEVYVEAATPFSIAGHDGEATKRTLLLDGLPGGQGSRELRLHFADETYCVDLAFSRSTADGMAFNEARLRVAGC